VTASTESVWSDVVGQPRAIAQLVAAAVQPVHAYLFVGPAGSTKDEAARAFAALLLAGTDDPHQRDARLALAGEHPDVHEVMRVGAKIDKDQVSEIIHAASMAPVEGRRKVMILHEFHYLDDQGAGRLLKTVEEPAGDTVFVVLADQITPDLVTIASRCVRIAFSALEATTIAARLVTEGLSPAAAERAAAAADGDLTRARVLATDPDLADRRAAFAAVPGQLDGSGATVVRLVTDLLGRIEASTAPLTARHADELAALEERVAIVGERGSGRKQLDELHKRELRRYRTDELRSGLAVLSGRYRDALVAGHAHRPDQLVAAVQSIHGAIDALDRNPRETLLLQALLLDLPSLPG
jgi:DNA polymerase III subunit delta'